MNQSNTINAPDKPESYTLVLTPVPGWTTPGTQRLRAALKTLLRSFGLKCVRLMPGGLHDGE